MKLVFSRKGIDSSFGNYASPIMPDGSLVWMPIPENNENKPGLLAYKDIPFKNITLGKIIEDLSNGRISENNTVHLDPDIFDFHRNREFGWKPIFGQTGAAEGHLRNKGVEVGDIFLFFGWFKKINQQAGKYFYERKAADLHVAYGWLQIGEIRSVNKMQSYEAWMDGHPHLLGTTYSNLDTLYIASNNLIINGKKTEYKGSGYFPKVFPEIVFSAEGKTRTVWELPKWIYPSQGKPAMSYNEDMKRWNLQGETVILNTASRGQEFVLDTDYYPESISWLLSLIKKSLNSI